MQGLGEARLHWNAGIVELARPLIDRVAVGSPCTAEPHVPRGLRRQGDEQA